MPLKVASWNINSIKARMPRLLQFLTSQKPDILCLQETKCQDHEFPRQELEALGYQVSFRGQKTYNGVAILSQKAQSDIRFGLEGLSEAQEARVLAATVSGVRVVSVYVPNGQEVGSEKYAYKLSWFKSLRTELQTCLSQHSAVIVAGDFNVAPRDIDVHDPRLWEGRILFSAPERAALGEIFELGLADTFRQMNPMAREFSWWDYRMLSFPKNHGLRIDFILGNPRLAEICTKAWIERGERKGEKPSDHAPVLAEFNLNE